MATRPYIPNMVDDKEDLVLENDADKLNHLLRMENNAILGYENAIESVDNVALKARLIEYRKSHSDRAVRLSNMINALNGDPVERGSFAGALHRNWLNLKAVAAGDNAEAVLEAVTFGERNLDEAYEDLLNNGELETITVRETVVELHKQAHALMQMTATLEDVVSS